MRMERWCSTAEPIIINSTGIDLISVRIDFKLLISTYYEEMNAFSESCSILAISFGHVLVYCLKSLSELLIVFHIMKNTLELQNQNISSLSRSTIFTAFSLLLDGKNKRIMKTC